MPVLSPADNRAVRTVVVDDHGRVLLLRRPDTDSLFPGHWNLPGGAIDPGEAPATAASRELREETGLTARNTGETYRYTFPSGVGVAYLYRDPEGDMAIAPREVAEAAWFYPAELPALSMPGTVEAVYALVGRGRASMRDIVLTDTRLRLEAWAARQIAPWLEAHVRELAGKHGVTLEKSMGDDSAGEAAMYRVLVRAMKLGRSEAAAAILQENRAGRRRVPQDLSAEDRDMLRTIARRNVRLVKATTEAALVPLALQGQAANVTTLLAKLYDMKRAGLIGADLVSKGYANGVIDVLKAHGYRYIYWRTMEDEKVCQTCMSKNNQRMTMRQFLKAAPAHPRCRCWPGVHPEVEAVNLEYLPGGPRVQTTPPPPRPKRKKNSEPPAPQVFSADASGQLLLPWRDANEPPTLPKKKRGRWRKSLSIDRGVKPMNTMIAALRALAGDTPIPEDLRKAIDPEALARIASENAKKRSRGPGGKFAAGKITPEEAPTTKQIKQPEAPTAQGKGKKAEPVRPQGKPAPVVKKQAQAPQEQAKQGKTVKGKSAAGKQAETAPQVGGDQSPLSHLPQDTKAPHALIEQGQKLLAHLRTLKPGTELHKHNLAQYNAIRNAIAGHNEKHSVTNQVPRGKKVKMPSVPAFVQGGDKALTTPKQFMLQLQRAKTKQDAIALGEYLENMERRDGLRGKDWDAAWDSIMAQAHKLPDGAESEEGMEKTPAKDLVKEHEHLVDVLEDAGTPGAKKEAKKQKKELDKYKEDAAGTDSESKPAGKAKGKADKTKPEEPAKDDHAILKDWAEEHISAGENKPAGGGEDKPKDKKKPKAKDKPVGDAATVETPEEKPKAPRRPRKPRQEDSPVVTVPEGREAKPGARGKGRNMMDDARRELEGKEREAMQRKKKKDERTPEEKEKAEKGKQRAKRIAAGLIGAMKEIQGEHTGEHLEKGMSAADALDELLKALIWVKEHQRANGTTVKAHQRNVQTKAERDELVMAIAKRMADGEHVTHANHASAIVSARAIAKQTGKQVHAYQDHNGLWRTAHGVPEEHAQQEGRVIAKPGKTTHVVKGKEHEFKGVRGPVVLHDPEKVKPIKERTKKEKAPKLSAEQAKIFNQIMETASPYYNQAQDRALKAYENIYGVPKKVYWFSDEIIWFNNHDGNQLCVFKDMLEKEDFLKDALEKKGFAATDRNGYFESDNDKTWDEKHDNIKEWNRVNRNLRQKHWTPSTQKQIDEAEPGVYRLYNVGYDNDESVVKNHATNKVLVTKPTKNHDRSELGLITLNVKSPLKTWDPGNRDSIREILHRLYKWDTFKEGLDKHLDKRVDAIMSGGKIQEQELIQLSEKYDAVFQRKGNSGAWINTGMKLKYGHDPETEGMHVVGSIDSWNKVRQAIEEEGKSPNESKVDQEDLRHYPELEKNQEKIKNIHLMTIDEHLYFQHKNVKNSAESVGLRLARHKEAVQKAIADGKHVPAEVRGQYFEFAEGQRLPKGPTADHVINTLKALTEEREALFDDLARWNEERKDLLKELTNPEVYPRGRETWIDSDKQKYNEAQDAVMEAQAKYEAAAKKVNEEAKKLVTGSGKAKYTVHFDEEIPEKHREAYQAALDRYAEIAGGRAGHRHVAFRYVKDHEWGLKDRAFYLDRECTIAMRKPSDEGAIDLNEGRGLDYSSIHTIVHEMAHGLEYEDPASSKKTGAFVFAHTENEYKKLNDILNTNRYQDYEMARPILPGDPAIWNQYLAKAYGKKNHTPATVEEVDATEVVSMGMEQLYKDPAGFILNHPEHFRVVWSLLRA